MIKSQKGKDMILTEDGYTYSKIVPTYWVCSTNYPACKAKIKFDKAGNPTSLSLMHTHPAKKFFVTNDGQYIRV